MTTDSRLDEVAEAIAEVLESLDECCGVLVKVMDCCDCRDEETRHAYKRGQDAIHRMMHL